MTEGKDAAPAIESTATAEPSQVQSLSSDIVGSQSRLNIVYETAGKIRESAGGFLKESKPWTELLDRQNLSRPENVSEATNRLRKNIAYFRVNYLVIVAMTIMICFVMNPSSLIILSLVLASWIYVFNIRTAPIVISGRTLNDRDKVMALSTISFVVVFFLTSVASVLFYAIALSCAVIALHGSMRQPEDLFLDDQQAPSLPTASGFLGLFKAVQQPTGPAAV
eukprot:TRINITY_DN18798_c0_g1_i2.p3 TRINITY_DN18798_c0_g1~~TRINITY_DN18798_c0_g1_i2.p3  ORF type:complete len:223 (+),score=25.83 TRINITY_DN18798_c0_g1_i2:142-810(+)